MHVVRRLYINLIKQLSSTKKKDKCISDINLLSVVQPFAIDRGKRLKKNPHIGALSPVKAEFSREARKKIMGVCIYRLKKIRNKIGEGAQVAYYLIF